MPEGLANAKVLYSYSDNRHRLRQVQDLVLGLPLFVALERMPLVSQRLSALRQVLRAIHSFHEESRAIHRDVHGGNILLLPDGSVAELIDFEFACRLGQNIPRHHQAQAEIQAKRRFVYDSAATPCQFVNLARQNAVWDQAFRYPRDYFEFYMNPLVRLNASRDIDLYAFLAIVYYQQESGCFFGKAFLFEGAEILSLCRVVYCSRALNGVSFFHIDQALSNDFKRAKTEEIQECFNMIDKLSLANDLNRKKLEFSPLRVLIFLIYDTDGWNAENVGRLFELDDETCKALSYLIAYESLLDIVTDCLSNSACFQAKQPFFQMVNLLFIAGFDLGGYHLHIEYLYHNDAAIALILELYERAWISHYLQAGAFRFAVNFLVSHQLKYNYYPSLEVLEAAVAFYSHRPARGDSMERAHECHYDQASSSMGRLVKLFGKSLCLPLGFLAWLVSACLNEDYNKVRQWWENSPNIQVLKFISESYPQAGDLPFSLVSSSWPYKLSCDTLCLLGVDFFKRIVKSNVKSPDRIVLAAYYVKRIFPAMSEDALPQTPEEVFKLIALAKTIRLAMMSSKIRVKFMSAPVYRNTDCALAVCGFFGDDFEGKDFLLDCVAKSWRAEKIPPRVVQAIYLYRVEHQKGPIVSRVSGHRFFRPADLKAYLQKHPFDQDFLDHYDRANGRLADVLEVLEPARYAPG